MNLRGGTLVFAPTDLANFLACRHKTALDLLVAHGKLARPQWVDPFADVLRRRGQEHERRYIEKLSANGLTVVDVAGVEDDRPARTIAAMRSGVDVIVQAALADGMWAGYADVLRRVPTPRPGLGAWSYEAQDTKLARETRGGTILQLCVYTDLIGSLQGAAPDRFHVVTPIATQTYRFDDFSAFYRQVKRRFVEFVAQHAGDDEPRTYPDPVEHCGVCRWSARCNAERRRDDHLSFVAGLGRHHEVELRSQGVTRLADLARLPVPIPFKP